MGKLLYISGIHEPPILPHSFLLRLFLALELAFDAKEFYPAKSITLIYSRDQLLNRFHPELHSIVKERAAAVGINLILGQRVKVPPNGFPTSGPLYNVELADGRLVPADVAVSCVGAALLSAPLFSLSPSSIDAHSKFILVKPTLQIVDPAFPNVFSIGGIAATGRNKAAAPGYAHAAMNMVNMIEGHTDRVEYVPAVPGIHLAIGLHSYVTFYDQRRQGKSRTFSSSSWGIRRRSGSGTSAGVISYGSGGRLGSQIIISSVTENGVKEDIIETLPSSSSLVECKTKILSDS